MELRKKRSTEEKRRRKGIDSFLSDIGGGFKELGNVWKERLLSPVKAAEKVGGALLGKDTGATQQDIIESVLGAVTLGTPGGLPKGAVGVGQTRGEALKTLGQSAVKLRPKGPISGTRARREFVIPTKNIRGMAANIRRSPDKALEPLTSIEYKGNLGKAKGMNIRDPRAHTSKIELAPEAGERTLFHEFPHDTSWAARGERNLQGYLSDLLETSTEIGNVRAATLNARRGTKRKFYQDQPVETHARRVSAKTRKIPGKISNKEYDKVFINEAKRVLKDVHGQSPNIYKKALKKVAKGYRKRAAQTKRVKAGKLPETFDEWMEGVVSNPKSKITRRKRNIRKGIGKKKYSEKELTKIINRLTPKRMAD